MRTLAVLCLLAFSFCTPDQEPVDSGPTSFVSRPVPDAFLTELIAERTSGGRWTRTPVEMAIRLRYFGASDRFEDDTTIEYDMVTWQEAVVSIHEHNCHDDSYHEFYTVITFRRDDDGYWMPVQYEEAWKGRGLTGWSTSTPM